MNRSLIRHVTILLVAVLLVASVGMASPAVPAHAASLTVNSSADNTTAGNGLCTLREAITNANSDSDTTSGDCVAGSGTDTITFTSGLSGATITLGSALPTLSSNMTIDNSANSAQVKVNGNDAVTVLNIGSGATVEIKNLTIEHGSAFNGGGIYNSGTLTITNSQILNNSSSNAGSGIFNDGGTVTINGSTVANNSPRSGFGQFSGTLTVTNSTFTGNYGAAAGGAIMLLGGTATVNQATIYGNSSEATGGIYNGGSVSNVQVQNSIITGNTSGNPFFPNCHNVGSLGYNLFGATGIGCTLLASDKTSDAPLLDGLAYHGGPTQTLALLSGSPAIDSGNPATCIATDQRGITRDATCDIGAYEYTATPDLTVTKYNLSGGSKRYPGSWRWVISISNNGTTNATFTTGQTLVIDNLPTNATYTDSGSVDLNLVTGPDPILTIAGSDLTLKSSGTLVIQPGGYYTFSIDVQPAAPGTFANPRAGGICQADPNHVVIENIKSNNSCSDTVISTAAVISLSTTSISFGNQPIGTTSAAQTVTVTNTGDANLHLTSLSTTGEFGLSNDTCSNATVAPNNTCTFDVVFSPASTGPKSGSVSIPSDAYSGPNSVSLDGNGINPVSATFTSVGAYDGQISETNETSNVGGATNVLGSFISTGDTYLNQQVMGFLHFNTSTLPDNAVVINADIQIKQYQIVGANPLLSFGPLNVDIAVPFFGADKALKSTDFQAGASAINAGSFNTAPLTGNWYQASLNSPAFPFVNLTGTTQFRLYFGLDDDHNSKNNLFRFFSGNHPNVAYRPVLIIQYYIP